MEPTYTLDDIARTTDEMAVRRRFDQRNLFWLRALMLNLGAIAFIVMLAHRGSVTDIVIAFLNVALAAVGLYSLRKSRLGENASRPARCVLSHTNAAVIAWLSVQYAFMLFFARNSEHWIPWAMTFPFILLALRMPVAELVLLHAVLACGAAVMPFVATRTPFKGTDVIGYFVGFLSCNAAALAIELVGSRRMRRQVRREWNERRTQAREQIRMRDELRYARELQLSMLPECAPRIGWADLCAISIPATEVGGDYYDYFVDGDRIALVCGDVAGHGMSSGLVLAALRSGFTLLRDELHDPAAVLRRLHDLVAQTSRRRMLVTVTVVLLDHATMEATIASAGHPPVLLRRADGTVETINLFAPPLGVRLPVSIPQRRIAVTSGDTFVLHSDGIYETLSADGETYGLDRLANVVGNHDGAAESLRDAIIADVDAFRGSAVPADDVTVVVAKVV